MSVPSPRMIAGLLALVAAASCGKPAPLTAGGTGVQPITNGQTTLSPAAIGDSGRAVTAADVHFMSGMISHHAQAVIIAAWAPTHGARLDVRLLCERIVVGQRDEIAIMQRWLRNGNHPVPNATDTRMHTKMDGMDHDMLMPGMLTDEQMKQLDKARGAEFDRLFLQGMIQHHQGAITMVNTLFGSYAAAQDETVFKFATDVYADQTTEIARMEEMLAAAPAGGRAPQ